MSNFDSLTLALQNWFDKPLKRLPTELRRRVDTEFMPMPWDSLSAEQRRSVALQLDYQHDPATEQDRKFWWDFFKCKNALKEQIAQWEAAAAPTAAELALKEERLAELRQDLAGMVQQEHLAPGDYSPEKPCGTSEDGTGQANANSLRPEFAYPKAMYALARRLDATPEELAAWVWLEPKNGGLAAYLNANELNPAPRFHYDYRGDFDYLSPLMACWFREDDISKFEPSERYITGKMLIERWSKQPGIQAEAFIRAKIAESRLLDMHPLCGGTQGGYPASSTLPPLESALFALSHVRQIEAEDLGMEKPLSIESKEDQPEVGSPEWRKQNARKAANALHDQPGGSRSKQQQIRDIWASGKYSSRDRCAEEECAALEMSYSAARRALKNTPDPKAT